MAASSRPVRARLFGGTALVFISAASAFADTEVISLDPIDVRATDAQGDSADRASSVYVADAELENARGGTLRDVFAGIANVSVGGAIPVAQKIFVNGVDMLNLTISMDGALQNNRVFHHASANVFDPGLLKFVRVDPGVAAADTGPNAVAGAVVMETLDAGDVIQDGKSVGGDLRLGYADNGKTFNRSLTLAGQSQGFEILLYGRSATGDNYEDGDGVEMTGTAADLQSGLAKLAYESDTGHRFELSGQQMDDSALRNNKANFGPSLRPLVRYDTKRKNYAFNYSFTQGGGMWDPEVVVGYSESDVSAPIFGPSRGITNTLSAKAQNTFHLSTGTVVAGVDYYDRTGKFESAPNLPVPEENSKNIGLFAQARFEPTDRWKISTGMRYDWQDFEADLVDYKNSFSGASGNVSAVYALTDELSLRGGYSNVFGGVQIEDNYLYFRMPGWDYDNLRSSRAQNANIGLDWTRGALSMGGELFWTEVNNVRDTDETFDFESKGINLNATYGWDNGFARLTVSNADTKRDGETASSGSLLDFGTPMGTIIALQLQQQLPQYNMLVGGALDMALDYDNEPSHALDTYPTQTLEGYENVSLFVEYYPPALPGVTLRGEVRNLFNQTFADRATYGGDYPGFQQLNEPGRTFIVEAIARF